MNSELRDQFAAKLPNAVKGQVVMRFAPEPSGYLHIGHAKAALLNHFFVSYYGGRLLLRFDDTNPTKEKMEFEESIIQDLKLLRIDTEAPTYTSDSIPQLEEAMIQLIKKGLAYCDDTPQEKMRQERMDGVESERRNSSVEDNLAIFEEMRNGTDRGVAFCVRAKIDMKSNNKALRDPVFYRCVLDPPHHRHGTRFKAYPTYDFACPLVDAWAGVTHAMRANEYADRIPQYRWVQRQFDLPECEIFEFSRLNLTNTVLSKRKLKWLVDEGYVDGWDDPRFPTVRGILRRGLTVEALLDFIIEQGPSKNTNLMEWDKLWVKNTREIDGGAKRFMAVSTDAIEMTIKGMEAPIQKMRPLHPKDASLGEIELKLDSRTLIEKDDAKNLTEGEEVTLMKVGNVIIEEIRKKGDEVTGIVAKLNLDGDVRKTKKLHWVCPDGACRFALLEYGFVITKKQPEEGDDMKDIVNRDSKFQTECIGEAGLMTLEEGSIIQLERRGYCRVDRAHQGKLELILIPSGKTKNMSTVTSKVDAKTLAKGTAAAASRTDGSKLSKKALKRQNWKASQTAAAPTETPQ